MSSCTENYSGIPLAPFHEDPLKLVEEGMSPEATLNLFQTLKSKYEMMMANLGMRESRINAKLSEILKSIDALKHLEGAESDMTTDFVLGDTMLAKAVIPAQPKVNLWLGANVMLEFPIPEAKKLLESKLADNLSILDRIRHDAKFTREQMTVMEVNISRLVNHLIESRRK